MPTFDVLRKCSHHLRLTIIAGLSIVLFNLVAAPMAAETVKHPLDGLTAPEYWTVLEPLKEEVLAWRPGQVFRREALVVVKQGPGTFEAVVDVKGKKLISWKEIKGVQPNLTEDEQEETRIDETVKANSEWQAAMQRRGITDYGTVHCGGYGTGYFGTAEEQGRRLLRVHCADVRGVWEDWGRPIEGLTVLWSANEGKILRVIDTGTVPVPQAPANFDVESVGPLREVSTPITVQQPLGPSFRVNGNEVSWQKWNFHFRIDRRVGLVVSNVGYQDGDKLRSILYEGSLSEMFVPYMDPDEAWYARTFFDAGEFADGFSTSLEPGADCPENSEYFDQVYANDHGIPGRHPRGACLFEQYSGDFVWRHSGENDLVESRRERDLVLRTIGTFGNYDYALDWVFRQDGTIRVRVGATGLDEVKGL